MPELPEIETLVSSMKHAKIEGSHITNIEIFNKKMIGSPFPSSFEKLILNTRIDSIERKGKYIVFNLSNSYFLLVHLKMTGHFFLFDLPKNDEKHEHMKIYLDQQKVLSFFDTRKFGKIYLLKDPSFHFSRLGPDPLDPDFDYRMLISKIEKSSKKIKALLLDQSFLSGLGNIYVDEALWKSMINPKKCGKSLSKEEIKKLFEAIIKVLKQGIKNKGTSLGKNSFNFSDVFKNFGNNQNHLNAYMQLKKPCSRCHTLITREKIAQRSSYFCPKCQS